MKCPDEEYFKKPIVNPRFIKKNYPEFFEYLNNNYNDCSSISEKLYLWRNGMDKAPRCVVCGNKCVFRSINKGFSQYCSIKCSNSCIDKQNKVKETNLKKYGVDNPMKSDIIKNKSKETNLKKYGAACVFQSDIIKNKSKETNLKKYGVEYTGASKEVQEKIKTTINNRYQLDSPLQLPQTSINRELARRKRMTEKYDSIIDVREKQYICKCPHINCDKCKEKYYTIKPSMFFDRLRDKTEPCTRLLPVQKSNIKDTTLELFIQSILDEHNIEYETNVRNIIAPKELDIYIPSKNIAIECNGVFSHCNKYKDNNYHTNKSLLCAKKGIQLLHIWEDWVKNNHEIIRSIILNKLGLCCEKIYARDCIVKEISYDKSSKFLKQNHIQGSTKSSVKLGLYYKGELVSVMTFGKRNGCCGSKVINRGEIELSRFCNKLNTRVIGGASRLLKYFIKHYNPKQIISFSMNDISDGNLYKRLGFVSDYKINQSYWWVKNGIYTRYHRSNFTKRDIIKLGWKDKIDDSWTEEGVMYDRGYFKIVDSGQLKWVLNLE